MKGKPSILFVCILIVILSVLNACNPSGRMSGVLPMGDLPQLDSSGHLSAKTEEPTNQEISPIPLNETDVVIPESEPLPTEEVINDASDPTYVYNMVKLAVANKDVSYLEDFFNGTYDIRASRQESCSTMPDWEYPPLEQIEEHMHGDLTCLGIQSEHDMLAIYYSGWDPLWADCLGYIEGADTGAFLFKRVEPGGDFVLDRIQLSSMKAYNGRCCGATGYYPYNTISCDVEIIPDFEQAVCSDALPQRLRIGGTGVVCVGEGIEAITFGPGDYASRPTDMFPFGSEFTVASGPYCVGDGKSWFQVYQHTENRVFIGYLPEGGSEEEGYYLCPKDEEWEQLLKTVTPIPPSTCPGSPPQRLYVGGSAMVCPSVDSVKVRDNPGMSGNRITSLRAGTRFEVIGGPECAGNNWSWWKVRLNDGTVGWMAEGGDQIDQYYLCPTR